MTLMPTAATKTNSDSTGDDPELSLLTDFANLVDKFNQTVTFLNERLGDVNSQLVLSSIILNENDASNVSAASTSDIGTVSGNYLNLIGAATINSFGTVHAGSRRIFKFDSSPTITHNDSQLAVPGNRSLTVSADDIMSAISLGSGNWLSSNFQYGSKLPLNQGQTTVWVPKVSMIVQDTNGPSEGSSELSTQKIMVETWDFDNSTQEYVQFDIGMPDSWDTGTVKFIPYWTAAAGAGTVIWTFEAISYSDSDALDTALSSSVTSTDTFLAADDLHVGPTTSALTIDNGASEGDYVVFRISRNGGTKSEDAKLLGVKLLYSVGEDNDA